MAIGNLVPLVGVIAFGWDAPSILVMYWIEAGVVGLINVLRIHKALAAGSQVDGAVGNSAGRPITRRTGSDDWLLPLTWLLAYGGFWAILGVFVLQIANGGFYLGASRTGWSGPSGPAIFWGTMSLVGGQLIAYVLDDVVGRRYLLVTSRELLRDPFIRIFVLIATIAVGGVGIAIIGAPIGFLGAMVAAKTVVELWYARLSRSEKLRH